MTSNIAVIMQKQFEHTVRQNDLQATLRLDHFRIEYFDKHGITVWEKYPCCIVIDSVATELIQELDMRFGNSELLMNVEHVIDIPNLENMIVDNAWCFERLSEELRELLTYVKESVGGEGYVILRC
jgi:hypothetical protein